MNPSTFRPNWLAIFTLVIGLIVVGWLLGIQSHSPDGQSISCRQEDMVQIVGGGIGVVVYCEDY